MYSVGHCIDPISVGVEGRKHGGFGARRIRIQPAKCAFTEKQKNFHRTVMRPEANTTTLGIVAAAEIGEVQSHFELYLLSTVKRGKFRTVVGADHRKRLA